jgi:hypothetical protein
VNGDREQNYWQAIANPSRKTARILSMIVEQGEKKSGPGGRFLQRLTD